MKKFNRSMLVTKQAQEFTYDSFLQLYEVG